MKCARCEQEIRRGATYWERVTGWAQRRTSGGTNHIALRRPTGEVMCEACMHVERANINPGQAGLGI